MPWSFTNAQMPSWWAVRNAACPLTVQPVITAIAEHRFGIAASKVVSPVITSGAKFTGHPAVSKTITPVITPTARFNPRHLTDSTVIVPAFAATATKKRMAAPSLTVVPGFTATLTGQPQYDFTTVSTYQNNVAPPTMTWLHNAASTAQYAIVAIVNSNQSIWSGTPSSGYSATVTFGGTAMTSLGSVLMNNTANQGWIWVFGLLNPPTGNQTVSVALSNSGGNFQGYAFASTYKSVSSVGSLLTGYGSNTAPNVGAISSDTTHRIWFLAANSTSDAFNAINVTPRINWNLGQPFGIAGDVAGTSSLTPAAGMASAANWAAVALNIAGH